MNFFTSIYELLPGVHDERELLSTEVFPMVGLITLAITFLMVVLYYYIMNGVSNQAKYNRTSYWLGLLVLNSIIAFFIALNKIGNVLEVASSDYEAYFYLFAIENALFSIILFFILSLVLKNWSKHAPYTPFRFPAR